VGVWKRLVRLVKIRLKLRKGVQDPLRVLQRDLELMDEKVLEVKHNSLALGKHRIQLQHRISELNKRIEDYQIEARKALRLGREDLAKLALGNKKTALATQRQLQQRVDTLGDQIVEFERIKDELANQIMIYKIKRDEVVLTRSAAEAELSAEELRWGLNLEDNFANSREALQRLEEEIHQIQSQAQATRELSSSQLPELPEDEDPPSIGVGAHDVSTELEQLKQELGEPR